MAAENPARAGLPLRPFIADWRHAEAIRLDRQDYIPEFPHRDYIEDYRQRYIDRLLGNLAELEKQTDPDAGDETAERKDYRAFDALSIAMDLVECVAGWAIDHQIGLAAAGLQFVPIQPIGTKNHPDYLKELRAVNTHEHERVGSRYNRDNWPNTPQFRRLALINLLATMHTNSLSEITHEATEALRALEFGETLPLVDPNLSGRKTKYRALLLQLKSIGMVEYLVALDIKKLAAQVTVGEYFGVSDSTLRTWEKRLRQEESGIGALKVSREIEWARNAASFTKAARRGDAGAARISDSQARYYSDAAMREAGTEFRRIQSEATS